MKEVQIAEDQSKTILVFQVPEYMVALLYSYSNEGCVDLDKFIEKAIKYRFLKLLKLHCIVFIRGVVYMMKKKKFIQEFCKH